MSDMQKWPCNVRCIRRTVPTGKGWNAGCWGITPSYGVELRIPRRGIDFFKGCSFSFAIFKVHKLSIFLF